MTKRLIKFAVHVISMRDKQHHRGPWHYINLPFKPEGQPASVQIRDPDPVNILTAMTENEGVIKQESNRERRAIAKPLFRVLSQ